MVGAGDTGIVDQNIDGAESGQRLLSCGFDLRRVALVHIHGDDRAILGEAGSGFLCKGLIAVPQGNSGAGCQQTLGNGIADPLCSARDNGISALEINLIGHKKSLP